MRLWLGALVASAALLHAPTASSCPDVDAINLANEADAIMATNLDAAIDRLANATKIDPSNARIFYKLARAYVKKEQWKSAAQAAATAATLAPTYATYHWLNGYALVRDLAWPEAKIALENAVRLDPGLADAHYDLATALEHLHDEQGALDHYTRAIRAAPSRTDGYAALADLYRRLGYADQAGAVVREALTWNPSGHAHFTLAMLAGSLAEERKALPEAIARYQEAKDACGTCNERGEQVVYFNLGAVLATAKPPRKSEAIANLMAFQKMICKGAAAARYADECAESQELMKRVTGP
jgi:tetratricopeptide (TPR) repeat protein